MRELKLALLRDFAGDLEREHGPVAGDELEAVRREWLGQYAERAAARTDLGGQITTTPPST